MEDKAPGLATSKNGFWALLLAGGVGGFSWLSDMTETAQIILAGGAVVGVIGFYLIGRHDRKTGKRVVPKDD